MQPKYEVGQAISWQLHKEDRVWKGIILEVVACEHEGTHAIENMYVVSIPPEWGTLKTRGKDYLVWESEIVGLVDAA